MSSDPDACLPQPLRDFVFDLHDSARRSQIPTEQALLYNGKFREISAKYFATSAWPSPDAVSAECGGDPLFLALYRELTQRHFHSISRVQVRDRIEGWHVYRNLFDLLLAQAEEDEAAGGGNGGGGRPNPLYIAPGWAFDIMHEFVYQFQGFCQFRTTQAANASNASAKVSSSSPGGSVPSPQGNETIEILSRNRDAWAVETVLFYLHRLVSVGTTPDRAPPSQAHRVLGIFSSVALSRLECLLGDYHASLKALEPIHDSSSSTESVVPAPVPVGLGDDPDIAVNAEDVVDSVFAARLSMAYHAGVSFLMLRRYKDATRVLGDICVHMQRGFKTGQLRKLPGSEQFGKNFDRMIALLAILIHICPGARVEDSVVKTVRDRYGNQLTKIEAGEEGYEDLFVLACPKFVNPAVPDYGQPNISSSLSQDVYKLQVKEFMSEMSQQHTLRKLRSYMKLYTSISVGKLAAFNDTQREEFLSYLLCYKHKMRQVEMVVDGGGGVGGETKMGSALDIHYYINGDMVHVDEAEKQRRFENFFMDQIAQSEEIMRDLDAISTEI